MSIYLYRCWRKGWLVGEENSLARGGERMGARGKSRWTDCYEVGERGDIYQGRAAPSFLFSKLSESRRFRIEQGER